MKPWPMKDPSDVLDYSLNWTEFLEDDADTITSSSWAVTPSGLTLGENQYASGITTVWVSGGTSRETYTITNTITTESGRTIERSVRLPVRDL